MGTVRRSRGKGDWGAERSWGTFPVCISGAKRKGSDRELRVPDTGRGQKLAQELERSQGLRQFCHLVFMLISNTVCPAGEPEEPGARWSLPHSCIPRGRGTEWCWSAGGLSPAGREADLWSLLMQGSPKVHQGCGGPGMPHWGGAQPLW